MNSIRCPKCGEVFTIDENSYADILKQIRDKEFEKELEKRQKEMAEIDKLRSERELKQLETEKDAEITKLKTQLREKEKEAETEVLKETSDRDKKIAELTAKLNNAETERDLAVKEAVSVKEKEIAEKNELVVKLKADIETAQRDRELSEKTIKESFKILLDEKDKSIEQLRDFKAKMSTKMVGESLEVYCEDEFNKLRATAFRNAYFEKDNDASSGSKGDFIFRDYGEDGTEFISIMFEMKNEMETTSTKHKNEDFFKKLDKDRQNKNCEYAILVSTLESESELYNTGIVDVSYKYDKMYVIRPQFFIPIITILSNTARNSLSYKQALVETRNKNIDITNFERDLNAFKETFSTSIRLAGQNFEKAMDEIDKTISHLEKVREALRLTQKQLMQADSKAEDLTIKKLVKNNPTMKAKFDELKGDTE